MAAPIPPLNIEAEDINTRLQAFLDEPTPTEVKVDQATEEPAVQEEPEKEPESPDEDGDDTPEVAASGEEDGEVAENPDDTPEGINTLEDLAKEFDIPTEEFLGHIEVEGPNGKVTLGAALDAFRVAPEAASRWDEIKQAEERLINLDQTMQAKNNEHARDLIAHTQVLMDELNADFGKVDWDMLERDDASAYVILKHKEASKQQKVNGAIASLKKLEADRNSNTEVVTAETRQREQSALYRKMPDWKDPKNSRRAMDEVQNFLVSSGFSQDEINGLVDHRFLLVAYQASKYNELQKQAPKKIEKLTRLPSTRTLKSSARRVGDRTDAQKKHAGRVNKLKSTGSDLDAALLLEAHIE